MWHAGFVAHQYVGSFWMMDQICGPCIAVWILNHWTTREVPQPFSPFAISSLSSLANKHVQISPILKKDLFLAQALPLTVCSLCFLFFSYFWRIFFRNYLRILASHSCNLSTMKSWFHLLCITHLLQFYKICSGNGNQWPPSCQIYQFSILIFFSLFFPIWEWLRLIPL